MKKIQDIISEITQESAGLAKKTDELMKSEKNIHQIEIDLLLSKVRSLYDCLLELSEMNEVVEDVVVEKVVESFKEEVEVKVDEEVVAEVVKIEEKLAEEQKEKEVKVEDVEEEPIAEEVVAEVEVEEKMLVVDKIEDAVAPDLFSSVESTVADKYQEDDKAIIGKLSKEVDDVSIAAKLRKVPVGDIKIEIGINQKFLFVNSLFDGIMSDYNESIEKLNTSQTLEEAVGFLDSLEQKYNWDKESKPFVELLDLVNRRYMQ